MPNLSEKQRRAMAAAKAGHSTLGIPQSVGEDFMSADPGGKLPESAGAKGAQAASRPPRGLTSLMRASKGKPQP